MQIDSCFSRALSIAAELRKFAASNEASDVEAFNLYRVALSIFPLILWEMDEGFREATAASIVRFARFRASISFAANALLHRQTPPSIARAAFPTLRPDRHAEIAVWWDEVAGPRWLAPYLERLQSEGRIEAMVARAEPAPSSEALRAWDAAHYAAWDANVLNDGKFMRV